jgi:glycosyltransferase involved in cell wall biosynthesis
VSAPVGLLAHASSELYGSDRVFLESVIALREAGWRTVVTLPQDGPLVAAVERAGARVALCPTPVLRKSALRPAGFARLAAESARGLRPMARLLREVRPDLLYVNTVTVPQWFPLARMFRRPVLAHVHEAENDIPAVVRFGLAAPLLAAHTVVVNSAASAAVLRRSVPRLEGRIRLVYNGVPGPAGVPAPAPAPAPAEPLRLVLVGRVSPRKGTDTAVEAVALLRRDGRKAELDIVGSVFPGYEWFEHALRERIRAEGLTDVVRFNGFHDPVWSAYRATDIALVPSRVEPFGNTSVEAQLAGVPVIVTRAQGLPETVDDGRFGAVVPPDDPRGLADAVVALADDWAATRERAIAAREHATSRFAPARYRREIARLAGELVTR